ncbi:glycosyltransferase, partial [Clostridium saudiense]|nr:glycosyltransferase [Clostridium saudiense]
AYDNGKVVLINNAIDLSRFTFDKNIRERKRKELKINDDILVIGNIGRFVKQKNHDFLIEIFNEVHKKNNKSILILVGEGPLQEKVKLKVKKLNLEKYVKFLGQRNDCDELYKAFDVFLLPSLYEGLPIVAVEAQASGLLCMLSDEMTKETKIINSTKFLSLSQDATIWSGVLLDYYNKHLPIESIKEMTKSGFNIKEEARKLESNYLKIIKQK